MALTPDQVSAVLARADEDTARELRSMSETAISDAELALMLTAARAAARRASAPFDAEDVVREMRGEPTKSDDPARAIADEIRASFGNT